MKANHKTVMVPFNGSDIEIKRGQFITGREKALKEMSELSPKKYRNAIKYLERTNRIHTDIHIPNLKEDPCVRLNLSLYHYRSQPSHSNGY